MPYKHAGEIGDVWKHLPLCEVLEIERPARYFETNSAYAGYHISRLPRIAYGVLTQLSKEKSKGRWQSHYIKTEIKNGLETRYYTGSPGIAMEILQDRASYYFYDQEAEALEDIRQYAAQRGLKEKVCTVCTDSIQAFLGETITTRPGDFVLIDPYNPFDTNQFGNSFFDVWERVSNSGAGVLFWYGYNKGQEREQIHSKLSSLAKHGRYCIDCFDVWQRDMTDGDCPRNPGVPGCGLAAGNLSDRSLEKIRQALCRLETDYRDAVYQGEKAPLRVAEKRYGQNFR